MTMITERDAVAVQTLTHRVVATVGWHLLPEMREALAPIHLGSVVVSTAVSWSDGECELSYRGRRYRRDRKVARVEITCAEHHVDAITDAIDRLLRKCGARGRAEGDVVAFLLTPDSAGAPAPMLRAMG